MIRSLTPLVLLALALATTPAAHAQRRGGTAAAGTGAQGATILYRQDFEQEADFAATGYCSARFLKGQDPDVERKARPVGFTVTRVAGPEAAHGSAGALKILITADRSQVKDSYIAAERYCQWPGDDATIALLFYAHGVTQAFIQCWDEKLGKNLHGDLAIERQDEWQMVRLPVATFTGWGSGAFSPGDTFGNLTINLSGFDPDTPNPYLLVDDVVIYAQNDTVPPTAPPGDVRVTAAPDGRGTVLAWTPAKDELGPCEYAVHRHDAAEFKPTTLNRLGVTAGCTFKDAGVTPGRTYYYVVVALDLGRSRAPAPTVRFDAPAAPAGSNKPALEF